MNGILSWSIWFNQQLEAINRVCRWLRPCFRSLEAGLHRICCFRLEGPHGDPPNFWHLNVLEYFDIFRNSVLISHEMWINDDKCCRERADGKETSSGSWIPSKALLTFAIYQDPRDLEGFDMFWFKSWLASRSFCIPRASLIFWYAWQVPKNMLLLPDGSSMQLRLFSFGARPEGALEVFI